ncbi:MAG: phytanoyl-CoA dioxygenase family protein [Pseudomonadota bacterium]
MPDTETDRSPGGSPSLAGSIEAHLQGRSFESWKADFDRDGFVVFENVLSPAELAGIEDALDPLLAADIKGRNDFEGLKSNRVYAMLAKAPAFVDLAIHPLALAFAEAELGKSCLLSACLAIRLHPGETVQPWHIDDSCELPRPRPTTGVSAFWAVSDTTAENGATEVIPGSHLWGNERPEGSITGRTFGDKTVRGVDDDPGFRADAVKLVMPAGSLALAKGTLMHRGGANRSDTPRTIITPQYCAGYMRQLENMVLAVPPEIARTLPPRAQALIGYSIQPPFMGYVDGMHPARTLS